MNPASAVDWEPNEGYPLDVDEETEGTWQDVSYRDSFEELKRQLKAMEQSLSGGAKKYTFTHSAVVRAFNDLKRSGIAQ